MALSSAVAAVLSDEAAAEFCRFPAARGRKTMSLPRQRDELRVFIGFHRPHAVGDVHDLVVLSVKNQHKALVSSDYLIDRIAENALIIFLSDFLPENCEAVRNLFH